MGAMGTTRAAAPDWREWRRLRAWALYQQGWKQRDIAAALGVSPGAVSQWMARGQAGGVDNPRHRPPPGSPPRLTPQQLEQLPILLARGAPAFGFRGEVWTTARVAAVIKREFNVAYHPAHVSRLLRTIGWSVQQPQAQASQRDDDAIRMWREQVWPALKKRRPRKVAPSSG